jgi:spermidine synthase
MRSCHMKKAIMKRTKPGIPDVTAKSESTTMENAGLDDDSTLPIGFESALTKSAGKPFAFAHADMRTLHFDERFIQSAMRISDPVSLLLSYTRAMMGFLLFNPSPRHIIMIGLGGGSLAKYCFRNLPEARITVLELDRDIIALRDQFIIPKDDARFRVVHTDALAYLATTGEKADIILHDGFNADGLAPSLSTQAFYRLCRAALEPEGILVSNLWGDAGELACVMRRLYAVFDSNLWWGAASDGFNRIVFAAKSGNHEALGIALPQRAMACDLRDNLAFGKLADRLQTALGKSPSAFEAIVMHDMRTAFEQGHPMQTLAKPA